MSAPPAVSVIWHISDRIAIRPEISFSGASTDLGGEDAESSSVEPGFSVLFYTARWDNVRAYVSPRYVYDHSSTSILNIERSSGTHDISGSVGAEFAAHRRFGIFGEVGIGFAHASSDSGTPLGEASSSAWRVRGAVGAILYF